MAVGDVYRLSCRWDRANSGDDAVNVFHFVQDNTPIFDTPEEDLVGAFIEEVELAYRNCVNPNYTLTLYSVRQVTGGAGIYEQPASAAGNVGSAGAQLPSQASGLISWRTGVAGRSKRGRTYLPPSDEAELASGLWNGDYLARMADFANEMITSMNTTTLTHGAWIFVVWSETLSSFQPITTAITRDVPATQVKRRLGRGS